MSQKAYERYDRCYKNAIISNTSAYKRQAEQFFFCGADFWVRELAFAAAVGSEWLTCGLQDSWRT